jgi:spore coat protein A
MNAVVWCARIFMSASLAFGLVWATDASAATVTIDPSEDNTIYEGTDPGSGEVFEDNSCGAGAEVFAGVTVDGFARRALLRFDIAGAVPAGSTIDRVILTMVGNRSADNQDAVMTLRPVFLGWGEGTVDCGAIRGGGQGAPANAGDATWQDAEFGSVPWTNPGGDFSAISASAVVSSANGAQAIWDSAADPAMLADAQSWLASPTANFGWILVGDEGRTATARRLWSREGNLPPSLTIEFTPTGDVFACCFDDGTCSVQSTTDCSDQGGTPDTNTNSCEPNPCPQPVGACCNIDESCSDAVDRLVCESAGGVFQDSGSTCNQGNVDCGLTPFVDALPLPPPLAPSGTRADGTLQYTIEVVDAKQQLHSELPDTDVWTYNGVYPSFTIEATVGDPIEVTYINNLPTARGRRGSHILEVDECAHGPNYYADSARIVTHIHGGHLPARFDGQPEYTILPGETDVYQYPNNQPPATLWYHDHALGITRLNVYAGMTGFYLLRDDFENNLGLPSGEFEIPLAIQDREFNPDGSLFYNPTLQDAFKGNKIVVNGKVWPFLDVKQGKYRFRMLNGSQAREYSLRLENLSDPSQVIPFTLIGTDLGLIDAPISMDTIDIMSPAERMDVVVDFSSFPAGTEIVLRNDDLTVPLLPNVMKFVVTAEAGFTGALPGTLRPVGPLDPTGVPTRYFRLIKVDAVCSVDPNRILGEWLIESLDGPGGNVIGEHWDDLSEFPTLGSREIWEFENPTNAMHPMHVHLVKFQVLDKTDLDTGQPIALEPWELNTWKDTVRVPPQSKVRIIMDFQDYLGKYAYHCHILDHEDHEMMRQFQTINDPANCNGNGTCEPGEDCVSCDTDCGHVSGALCGNGLCEAGDGENCVTCAADCAGKQKGAASKQFCCGFDDGQVGNPVLCGVDVNDDRCIDSGANLFCRVAPRVLACCGDALCEGEETIDGVCDIDCAPDAGACTPTEPTEVSCFDDVDNDCNNDIDCADANCDGATGPATTCGTGVCASTGNLTCTGRAQDDTCVPLPATEPGTELTCNDGLDNDCDGLTDSADPDCQVGVDCSQFTDSSSCRNAPNKACRWDNKNSICVNK